MIAAPTNPRNYARWGVRLPRAVGLPLICQVSLRRFSFRLSAGNVRLNLSSSCSVASFGHFSSAASCIIRHDGLHVGRLAVSNFFLFLQQYLIIVPGL
jgi:hypothetical protein